MKEEHVPKQAEHGDHGGGGDRLGTLTDERFREWWFDPVVKLLLAIKNAKTKAEHHAVVR